MQKNLPYSQILDFLTELVDKQTTGTLFVHSESNRAITIALDRGRIHALYFGARRGRKAIPLISSITGGSYRLELSDLVEAFHDLPPTHEILNLLRNPQINNKPSPTVSSTSTSHIEAIEEEKKEILCQKLKSLLAEHVGPIAEIVFDDTAEEVGDFCSTPQLTQDLINKLSEEIDNPDEMEQFKDQAYVTLSKILHS
ncbi:hypothetical protein [Candidatus Thiodiazotropha sp. CDECU1]|uniref:hypothetical protein n=1 Tax=Candidatus Thiodiazotropha sp. CDECU1 TaxID=3065865 RepID=UPI002931C188|nr:hypothetical protein [Candidatus Thiodiazotropha sp. CDECU1]